MGTMPYSVSLSGCGCHVPLAPLGACTGWDNAVTVPLSIVFAGAPPTSPALLPLSLVPAAPRVPILAWCLPPPPSLRPQAESWHQLLALDG